MTKEKYDYELRKSHNEMLKQEILMAIKEIQCRYSILASEQNYTNKDYACKQFEKLVIYLANEQEDKDKEINRLNNIIDELEKYMLERRLTDIDGRTMIYQILYKLNELKGDNK